MRARCPATCQRTGLQCSKRDHGDLPHTGAHVAWDETAGRARWWDDDGHDAPPERLRVPPVAPPPSAAWTGDVCTACGSAMVVRTGTCWTCMACGTTGGCG